MGTQAKSDLASSLLAYLPASQSRLCYSSMHYKSHTCLPGTQSQDNDHVFLSGGFLLFAWNTDPSPRPHPSVLPTAQLYKLIQCA